MITLKEIVLSTASPFQDYISWHDNKEIVGRGQLDAFAAFLKAKEVSQTM